MQLVPISKKDTKAQEAGLAAAAGTAGVLTAKDVKNARKYGKEAAHHQSKLKEADKAWDERYKWRPNSDKHWYHTPERKFKAMKDKHDTLNRAHRGPAEQTAAKAKNAKILGAATAALGTAAATTAGVKYARRKKEARKQKKESTVSVYKSAFGIIHKADGAELVRRRERRNTAAAIGTGLTAAGSAGVAAAYGNKTKQHAKAAYKQGLKTPQYGLEAGEAATRFMRTGNPDYDVSSQNSLRAMFNSGEKTADHLKNATKTGKTAALAGAGALALGGVSAYNINRNRNIRRNREQNMASEDRLAAKLKGTKVSKALWPTKKTKRKKAEAQAARVEMEARHAQQAAQQADEAKHVVPKMKGGTKLALAGGAGLAAAGAGAAGYAHYNKKNKGLR